jgi:hypothetical protein
MIVLNFQPAANDAQQLFYFAAEHHLSVER